MFSVFVHRCFPSSKYRISTLGEIGVLGPIKLLSMALSLIQDRELLWVPMPVVTIELNYQRSTWDESIDAEFFCDDMLS